MCGYNSYNETRKPLDNEIVQISGKEYKELLFYKEMWETRDCSWPKYTNNKYSTQAFNPMDNDKYDRE